MYKITNKSKYLRKFIDRQLGKYVFVEPGKFILTVRPIKEDETWSVEEIKSSEKKKIIKSKEEK